VGADDDVAVLEAAMSALWDRINARYLAQVKANPGMSLVQHEHLLWTIVKEEEARDASPADERDGGQNRPRDERSPHVRDSGVGL
jgi:hypothetical protein